MELSKILRRIKGRSKRKVEGRCSPWLDKWDAVPPNVNDVCNCDTYGTKHCPMSYVEQPSSIVGVDDAILKVLDLLPPHLHVCLKQYTLIEHHIIDTVRTGELNDNTKWHICGGGGILGNANSESKNIDLFWFNHDEPNKDLRISQKIETLVHELHHAFQHLYQARSYKIDREKYHWTESRSQDNWIEDDADTAALNFLIDRQKEIEDLFDISLEERLTINIPID